MNREPGLVSHTEDGLAKIVDINCARCGGGSGQLRFAEMHVGLYCSDCHTWQQWIGKRELGIATRSLASRPRISPSLRSRVFDRDGHRCIRCGYGPPEVRLVVGHMISVRDGQEIGIEVAELYGYWNLCAMCEECNAGLGERSMYLPDVIRQYHRWLMDGNRRTERLT